MRNIAILISGRGSNMESLLHLRHDPNFKGTFTLVLSNRKEAQGLDTAKKAGIKTLALNHKDFSDRESFDRAMHETLVTHGVDLVVLAGFMRILSPWFVSQWQGRLINIHPSLLPLFRGTNTHQRALAEGIKIHGCTVHFVVPELDAGPIIAQAAVPVLPNDNEHLLAERVLVQEHRLYPKVLTLLCNGSIGLEEGKVTYKPGRWHDETSLVSPETLI